MVSRSWSRFKRRSWSWWSGSWGGDRGRSRSWGGRRDSRWGV